MQITVIKILELSLLLTLSVISDIKLYKIKNFILLPFVIIGILTNFIYSGIHGLGAAFLGLLLPVLILIVFYGLRMLGAGDIKLFGTIGAITGIKVCLLIMAYSFISGGVIALFLVVSRRNGLVRVKYLIQYLKTCLICFTFLPYTDFSDKSDGGKFHFAVAITLGILIYTVTLVTKSGGGF